MKADSPVSLPKLPAISVGLVSARRPFLPAGYTDAQAMAIDSASNIAGYAGSHAFPRTPAR